jgi:hypothetical protein
VYEDRGCTYFLLLAAATYAAEEAYAIASGSSSGAGGAAEGWATVHSTRYGVSVGGASLDSGNVSEAIRATFSEMLSSRDDVEEELCRQRFEAEQMGAQLSELVGHLTNLQELNATGGRGYVPIDDTAARQEVEEMRVQVEGRKTLLEALREEVETLRRAEDGVREQLKSCLIKGQVMHQQLASADLPPKRLCCC